MHVNRLCVLWLLGTVSYSCLAAEGAVSPGVDTVTLGQLEAIQAQNFLLEQQVQTARLQRQLRESENDTGAPRSPQLLPFIPTPPGGDIPARAAVSSGVGRKAPGVVRLQEIYGRGTRLRARILLPQGGVTEVSTGDPLPGSTLRVTAVTQALVKLSDGSELSF
jgi:type IV pilus biogenesis protein PilP